MRCSPVVSFVPAAVFALTCVALMPLSPAAELARLNEANWDTLVPQGKEVDAIYGDLVLRSENVVAVIANPVATRNANMTVRGVGGCLIDLTERAAPNDQLSCYFPGAGRYQFVGADGQPAEIRVAADGISKPSDATVTAKSIVVEIDALPVEGRPQLTVRYTLADDAPFLLVETIYANPTDAAVTDDLSDAIRADRTFTFGFDASTECFWADDEWFRQSYGVMVPGYEVKGTGQRGTLLALNRDGSNRLELAPGKSHAVARKIFPASSDLARKGRAAQLAGQKPAERTIVVVDPDGPVVQAHVTVTVAGQPYASGRTGPDGKLTTLLPDFGVPVEFTAKSTDGRTPRGGETKDGVSTMKLPAASYVAATITNDAGKPTPAKVSFTGLEGTTDPDWGPDSGDTAVKNVYYTHNGTFRQPIAPGKYQVIISYGPEHDAVFQQIEVPPQGEAKIAATLVRSVDTTGWISSDFHSHSSPSGDNTSSQFGRVQNLLCEQIEFAPCTEHNRIDTYVPHLEKLGATKIVATCSGMELTGGLLPVNHQNAFPLLFKPRTQDGGGPITDTDPVVQVERLALWDGNSEKLVQMNHPNLPQILGDRDLNGEADVGFAKMFGFVDVIEIHPPQGIFTPPSRMADGKLERNPIFHWMQMLNLGHRHTGVINTDAHYNYHESGYFRNFIASPTDDPAKVDTMEVVRASEQGNVVVSTGPFLSVEATTTTDDGKVLKAIPGEDLAASGGEVSLAIRVQCPNWFDVNRVQVFLNGRPEKELNFTRRTTPDRFTNDTVRFDAKLRVPLKTDTHVIVATIGEGLELGPVMGPNFPGKLPPAAVANPIFVDVDGGGFKANGDLLDVPIALAP
jgi:hypothetical protein